MYKSPPIYSPSHALYALKSLRAVATVNSRIHGGFGCVRKSLPNRYFWLPATFSLDGLSGLMAYYYP